jgi:hypothetical protein
VPRDDRQRWEQSTHTRAVVSFHTDDPDGFDAPEPIRSHPDFGEIISVSTEKTMGAAAGTFTIVVKKPPRTERGKQSWKNLWADPEEVWVRIKFIVDGETIDTMFGQIDSVSESTSRSGGGARNETFTISGRDFGKVFETTEMFTNFYASEALTQSVLSQAWLIQTGLENLTGTPAHFVRFLIETWLANNGIGESQWMLPASLGGDAFHAMLNLTTIQDMDQYTNGILHNPNIISVDGQQGSKLWESMSNLSHGLLNEMWVDLAPPPTPPAAFVSPAGGFQLGSRRAASGSSSGSGLSSAPPLDGLVPSVYLRERPFPIRSDDGRHSNHRKWDQLRTRRLRPGDVQSRSLARGGASHRYNYWQLDAVGLASQDYGNINLLQRGIEGVEAGRPGNNPIFNAESMGRHGVRRYAQSTRFLPMRQTDTDAETWVRVAARWLKKLHDWYVIAPLELSGSLTLTRIMPEIRIGERVSEERHEGKIFFYCEGVQHEWQYPNAGRTTLTLTRGEYEDEDLLDRVYDQYENPRMLSARERCFVPAALDTDVLIATGQNQSNELVDALARGCGFGVVAGDEAGFGTFDAAAGEVSGPGDQVTREQRTLTAERDGTVAPRVDPSTPATQDSAMNPSLNDTDPAIAGGDLPAPGATADEPGDPTLSRDALETGEPIQTEDFSGLDFDDASGDPILGIEDIP